MIPLTVLLAVVILASLWERHNILFRAEMEKRALLASARLERQALEDRLIALTDRDASVLVHAQEHIEPGDVTYVDERKEWELDREMDE